MSQHDLSPCSLSWGFPTHVYAGGAGLGVGFLPQLFLCFIFTISTIICSGCASAVCGVVACGDQRYTVGLAILLHVYMSCADGTRVTRLCARCLYLLGLCQPPRVLLLLVLEVRSLKGW